MKNVYPKRYEKLKIVSLPRIPLAASVGLLIAGIVVAGTILLGIFSHVRQYAGNDTGIVSVSK